jgi:hypothetical protein
VKKGAFAFLLLTACAQERDAPADSPLASAGSTSTAGSPATWRLSETGWGPIRAGMSVAEARATLGGQLAEPGNRECDHVRPPSGPAGVLLMIVGGEVARVQVRDSSVATTAGARIGDTEARINQLYPGRVRTTPHKYTDGHYLTVAGAGADSVHRLVFETDGQRVTEYRAGRIPEVEWVEGCS